MTEAKGPVVGLAWTYTTLDGGSRCGFVDAPGRSGKLEVLGAIRLLEEAAMERWFENT